MTKAEKLADFQRVVTTSKAKKNQQISMENTPLNYISAYKDDRVKITG